MRVSEIRVKPIRDNQRLGVQMIQILITNVQMVILCLSYFITTVCTYNSYSKFPGVCMADHCTLIWNLQKLSQKYGYFSF